MRGIRLWKGGRQAYIEIHGKTYSKTFPLTDPITKLQGWRDAQRLKYGRVRAARDSFAADIQAYLARIEALPTYKQRAAHLEAWAGALGRDRARSSITRAEIETVMQDWLRTPTKPAVGTKGRPSGPTGLAPATVRKRRVSLLALFHTLDGQDESNPVKASRAPRAPKAEARALPYEVVTAILAAVPESVTKRRLTVIAYTGLPPAILTAVTRADLDLQAGTVRVRPRRKGAGVEARTLALLPQGVTAFRAFDTWQAYGPFAVQAANRSFQRACRRVGVQGATLYDLRHSFATHLYSVTKDLATVARFLLHASPATTVRYAQAAMRSVDQEAAARAGAALTALTGAGEGLSPPPVPPAKPTSRKPLRRAS